LQMTEALLSARPGTGLPNRRPGLRGFLVVLAVLLVAGGLLVAVLMGWVMPKKYESTVVIQVLGGMRESSEEKPSTEMMDAEARRVVGVPTFDRVRERLQLEKRWDADAEEVTEILRGTVQAEVREGTDLIEITARHTSPGDARDVAIGLAEEYSDLRKEEEIRKAQMALDALDAELKVQEDKVEEKRKMLDQLLEGSGMSIDEAVEDAVEKQAICRSEEQSLLELGAEGHHLDEVVRGLGKLRGSELFRYAASLELPQNTASILWAEYETLLAESEKL
jgi:capsular polysaccharide biosynthesis protein